MQKKQPATNQQGLSLVEILVGMTAFVVIFTGLASTFQALMIANRVTVDLSDAVHHYRNGMRLLREGDYTEPGRTQAGLLQADRVQTVSKACSYENKLKQSKNITVTALRYWVGTDTYTIWAENGELLREDSHGKRVLMGKAVASPTRRIMVDLFKVAFVPEEADPLPKTLVILQIGLHGDTDTNDQPDANEARFIATATISLRNAGSKL